MVVVAASASSSTGSDSVSFLGRGIYDVSEAARLIRSRRARVEGWTRPEGRKPPLLTGELAGLFSFWDLLSLRVIAELARRGVPRVHIARGADHLKRALGTDRPFAHEGMATVGAGFFADIAGGWEDAGRWGQLAFHSVIEPILEPIVFNDSGMAAVWKPHESVWINPAVQAGSPCVDGTRVPTQTLASLLGLGEPEESELAEVCDDFRLTPAQVSAALRYELALAA